MINEKDRLLIDQYLNNELEESALQAFEQRLLQDEFFAKEFKIAQSMNRFLEHKEDVDTVTGYVKEFGQQYKAEDKPIPIYKRKTVLAALAAAIALLILVLFLVKDSTTDPYLQYAKHETISLEKGSDELNLTQAVKDFNAKKYASALAIFEQNNFTNKPEFELAQGICYLELNQFDKAKTIFNHLVQTQQIYRDQGYWYLALTALKQKEYPNCKRYLSKISNNSIYQKEVQQLLSLIEAE